MQLELLLHGLAERGVAQHLRAPEGSPLAERWPSGPFSPKGRWWGRRALTEAIEAFRPDLLAVHTSHAHALAPSGIPVVVHRRNDFVPSMLARRRLRRACGVVAVSRAVARVVRRAGAERVVVVRDGVARRSGTWAPKGGPHFLAVGALVAHKGHGHLIDAMTQVPGRLDIVGEGPLRGALAARIRAQGLEGRVRLLGTVGDVDRRLCQATALVHPSLEEGLGQVVLEALALGVPVVASAVGGLPEVLDGVGTLVPPGDALALARALTRDLPRPRVVWRSADAMVDETLAAYQRFLR